jgi:hypothetical protein
MKAIRLLFFLDVVLAESVLFITVRRVQRPNVAKPRRGQRVKAARLDTASCHLVLQFRIANLDD